VDELICANRRVKLKNIFIVTDISIERVHHITHDLLGYLEIVCAMSPKNANSQNETAA